MPSRPDPHDVGFPYEYRLAPLLAARFLGGALVVLALVMFAGTALVALTGINADVLVVVLVLGVVAVFVLGWWLRSRAYVVRVDESGYRVRFVRGVGVAAAGWDEVEKAATATSHDQPVLVLGLRDGRTSTIPVQLLAVDREAFVRQMQRHLRRGQRPRS